MSTTTPNLNLTKDDPTDFYDVAKVNANLDKIDASFGTIKRSSAANYYINTATGSDTNDGLTAGTAFKTIQKAVNVLPTIIDADVTINVASGTYAEVVTISGKLGAGRVIFSGSTTLAGATNYKVNRFLSIRNKIGIFVNGFECTSVYDYNGTFQNDNSDYMSIYRCRSVTAKGALVAYGVYAIGNSFTLVNDCELSNKSTAIGGTYGAKIHSPNNAGVANDVGLEAFYGAVISKDTATQPIGTVRSESQWGGGFITNEIDARRLWWNDRRGTNPTPQSYIKADHGGGQTLELFIDTDLGFGSNSYTIHVTTTCPWIDTSAGVIQIAVDPYGSMKKRTATSATTWSAWTTISTHEDGGTPFLGTTTNSVNNYAITSSKLTNNSMTAGQSFRVKFNTSSSGAVYLNVNGTGLVACVKANGNSFTNAIANGIYTFTYNGTNFVLQGEGASGNAVASDLRSGKTASTDAGDITGTAQIGVYSGTFANSTSGDVTISLPFVPKFVIAFIHGAGSYEYTSIASDNTLNVDSGIKLGTWGAFYPFSTQGNASGGLKSLTGASQFVWNWTAYGAGTVYYHAFA